MELVIVLLCLLVFMFTVVKSMGKKSTNNDFDLIPGPRKLPLIGNLHLVAGNSPLQHVFKDLSSKYGPIMRLQFGEITFIVVSSVEVAEQVLKTHDQIFANRPQPGFLAKAMTYDSTNIGLSPYGEYWRYLRKICALELFSTRRVKSFRPIREEEYMNLCKCIAAMEGSPVNLTKQVCQSSFNIIARATFGNKTKDPESVTSTMKEAFKLHSGVINIVDLYPSLKFLFLIRGAKAKLDRFFQLIDGILDSVINQHKVANANKTNNDAMERSENLAHVLLKHQDDGSKMPLTANNIKAVILDMFLGGVETSAITVDWAMSEMIKNPTILKRAQEEVRKVFDDKGYVDESKFDELKYLKLVIKETLRLHPPLPLTLPRESSQACEVNGYKLAAKTRVIINAWALGRDPKYWKESDEFIPERFQDSSIHYKGNNFEYIPFGAGRRICPGISLGMANVEFPLATLLYHFDWEMPNGIKNQELDMEDDPGFTAKRKHDLLMIPTVKRPLQLLK